MKSFDEYRAAVENALGTVFRTLGPVPDALRNAMQYSLSAGGKRLRPVLLLAACEMAGGTEETALPFACAVEMIHTYSLIHDDLPAMDNDDLRRGKPTSHKVFGEGMAVLAGDGLLNAAVELMSGSVLRSFDIRHVKAMEIIMRHAGVTGMIAGQAMDLQAEGGPPDEQLLRYIHHHKTADLLMAPVEAGLLLGGADDATIAAGSAFAFHLGLAFQMTDDLLDVIGDAHLLGKETGKDAEQHKLTWVSVRGVGETRRDAEKETELALQALEKLPGDHMLLQSITRQMTGRKQ